MMQKTAGVVLAGGMLLVAAAGCTGGSKDSGAAEPPKAAILDNLPLGLDPFLVKIPADNPVTDAKIELGWHLYFDKRMSNDGTVACATCHAPDKGWTDQAPVSTGINGQKGGRSAPTVINRVFSEAQFWDGRAASLEEQAMGPITNPIEMGMDSHDSAIGNITKVAGYKPLFAAAFGDDAITIDRVAKAIASFERTIVSGNSPFDRYEAGDKSALSESAARGLELFRNKARCAICHAGPNFSDEKYHNIGVGMDKPEPDIGRQAVSGLAEDRGKFKTPGLRNIADQAPYMHDGSEADLMAVVEFYDKGGISGAANPTLDPEMKPLQLSPEEKKDLVEFLNALSGDVTKVSAPDPLE